MRFERESEILGKLIARGLYFSEQLLLILKKKRKERQTTARVEAQRIILSKAAPYIFKWLQV